MSVTRTMPAGTEEYSGAEFMDKVKEELEAVSRGEVFRLFNVSGANTITANALAPINDLYDGMRFAFEPESNNSSGVTLRVDNTGAKSVRDADGDLLEQNALVAARTVEVMYLLADDQYRVLSGLGGSNIEAASVILANQQSNTVAGGTATAGSWQTYTLNTEVLNDLTGEGSALSSNEITLPAGKYIFHASAPFYQTGNSKLRLYNVSDATVVADQSCSQVNADATDQAAFVCALQGKFEISSTKVFRLEYRVQTTNSGDGLGEAASFSEAEQYGVLTFLRPAEGGVDGVDGADGSSGYVFAFDTAVDDSDPGDGEFKFDNASIASVTGVHIDDLEGLGSADISAVIAAWGSVSSSVIQGTLLIKGIDDPGDIAEFRVTGVTAKTGYSTIDVTYVSHDGTFSVGQNYAFQFSSKGDKGDTGSTGATGPNNGWDYQWNTATSGDPGDGYIRSNNATFASITQLAIDDLDRNAVNNEAGIQASDDSTTNPKSYIRIVQVSDRTKFMEFELDSVWADQTGYWLATVTPVQQGNAIDNDAIVSITMYRSGDTGGLQAANNLSDVNDASQAAQNIGALEAANNLSDVDDPDAARDNIDAEPKAKRIGVTEPAGSYTLVLTDAGKDIQMQSASANNLTIPPNASVAFETLTVITGGQYGAGTTTIVAGSGVTIRSRDSKLTSGGQYARWEMMKIDTNEWWIAGDLV